MSVVQQHHMKTQDEGRTDQSKEPDNEHKSDGDLHRQFLMYVYSARLEVVYSYLLSFDNLPQSKLNLHLHLHI